MTAGDLIRFLEEYDEREEVEIQVHFDEVGGSYAPTSCVTTFSDSEIESGRRNCWPTITAHVGFGTMADEELRSLIDYVKGIERRRGYNRKCV